MRLSKRQISELIDYFGKTRVQAVYVFGSYARGDADAESDLDLLLEFEPGMRVAPDLARLKRDLGPRMRLTIDVYEQHRLLRQGYENIRDERVLLYRRA